MSKPLKHGRTLPWSVVTAVCLLLGGFVWAMAAYRIRFSGDAVRNALVFQTACLAKTIDAGWCEDFGGDSGVAVARMRRLAQAHFRRCCRVRKLRC